MKSELRWNIRCKLKFHVHIWFSIRIKCLLRILERHVHNPPVDWIPVKTLFQKLSFLWYFFHFFYFCDFFQLLPILIYFCCFFFRFFPNFFPIFLVFLHFLFFPHFVKKITDLPWFFHFFIFPLQKTPWVHLIDSSKYFKCFFQLTTRFISFHVIDQIKVVFIFTWWIGR